MKIKKEEEGASAGIVQDGREGDAQIRSLRADLRSSCHGHRSRSGP